MKRVLIISPYFPPFNAADMQRVRMSLPYFKEFGWEAEVVKVASQYLDLVNDPLLLESIPKDQIIHEVAALPKKWTSKFGLGSIALRSLYYYKKKVNHLLKTKNFDLIYFSTTQFPVCILGAYWKNKFKIPYIIDVQDPWHSDYYKSKPKTEWPKKYWFSYRLNKYLEPIAMKHVDGLISVSDAYIKTLKSRYPVIKNIPASTITFGASISDLKIAENNKDQIPSKLQKSNVQEISIGYIGRGGYDMQDAIKILFDTFKSGLIHDPEYFNHIHFYFIGTSYAKNGNGIPTIQPLADKMGLKNYVSETTDRLSFYQSLNTLKSFDILFICGSNDAEYTASKIYPYLLLEKPLLAIFHKKSSVVKIINTCSNATVITFQDAEKTRKEKIINFLKTYNSNNYHLNWNTFNSYTAKEMTRKQIELFNNTIVKQT